MVRSGAEVSFCAISTLVAGQAMATRMIAGTTRSEEHTSELQSRLHLVCRLLLEKKNLDDIRGSSLFYQLHVTTYQAYNDYPFDNTTHNSLNGFNTYVATTVTLVHNAATVSFNLP